MENKSIYEQYKQAMLKFYKRMEKEGYKGNPAYTPMISKNDTELLIHTNSSANRLDPQGVDFRYDAKTKELSVLIGSQEEKLDEDSGQKLISEMLILHYHPDETMDVIHQSEDNLTQNEKLQLDEYSDRTTASSLEYAKNAPSVSIDELFNMSDILDQMAVKNYDFFEKLHDKFKFQAPEFDIEAQKEKEDNEPSL